MSYQKSSTFSFDTSGSTIITFLNKNNFSTEMRGLHFRKFWEIFSENCPFAWSRNNDDGISLCYETEDHNINLNEAVNIILRMRKFYTNKGYKLQDEAIPIKHNNCMSISLLCLYENKTIVNEFIGGHFTPKFVYCYDGNNDTDNENDCENDDNNCSDNELTEQNRVVIKSD